MGWGWEIFYILDLKPLGPFRSFQGVCARGVYSVLDPVPYSISYLFSDIPLMG